MASSLQEEDLFNLFFLVGCCYNLLDELYGSSVAVIVAPLCVLLLVVAARSAWLRHPPPPFRKKSTWISKISASSMLVLLMRSLYFASLTQILVFGCLKTINIMILNTSIFALGCSVRLSRARGADLVSMTISKTSTPSKQPQAPAGSGVPSTFASCKDGACESVKDIVPHPPLGSDPVSRAISDTSSPSKQPQAPASSDVRSTLPSSKDGASHSVVDIVSDPPPGVQDTLQKNVPSPRILSQVSKKTDQAETWFLDSGASFSMTGNWELLSDFKPVHSPMSVMMVYGPESAVGVGSLRAVGVGSLRGDRITLPEVFFIPGLAMNIISVSSLSFHSARTTFGIHGCSIHSEKGEIIGRGTRNGEGQYTVDHLHLSWKNSRTSMMTTGNDVLSSQSKVQQVVRHIHELVLACSRKKEKNIRELGICAEPSKVCSNDVDLSNNISSSMSMTTVNDVLSSQSKARQAAGHIREPGICDPAPSQVCSNNIEPSNNMWEQAGYIDEQDYSICDHATLQVGCTDVDVAKRRCTMAFPATQATRADFIVDSGAGKHMTGLPGLQNLVTWPPREDNIVVGISGHPMPVTGVGSAYADRISLHNVSQVPGLDRLLVSVSQLTMEYPVKVIFDNKCCIIEHEDNGEVFGYCKMVGGLYLLHFLGLPPPRGT